MRCRGARPTVYLGTIFEHLLDAHVDVVAIELEQPFGNASARASDRRGAGREDEDAEFRHSVRSETSTAGGVKRRAEGRGRTFGAAEPLLF